MGSTIYRRRNRIWCFILPATMYKPKSEARIALMSKKDLREDLLEEILSWVMVDKNCKSPVVDPIHNSAAYMNSKSTYNPLKSNSFKLCRMHILERIHDQDLRVNYKSLGNYNSVVQIQTQGVWVLGMSCQVMWGRDPNNSLVVIGYYDKSKFKGT